MSRRIFFPLATVLVVALIALFGLTLQSNAAEPLKSGMAPDFTFTPYDGEPFRLSDLRGKVVVVNIWASWCDPCKEEAPILEKTWRAYKDRGVMFLGVDYVDTESEARAYLKFFDITYPNGPDIGTNIYRLFHARGVPETYFIDRQGHAVSNVIGKIDESTLRGRLDGLLTQQSSSTY